MPDLENRIDKLEKIIEDLRLDQHAARIAITTMSTVWNAVIEKQSGALGNHYDAAVNLAEPVEFESPVPEGYAEELHKRVVALLSKGK